MSTFEEQIETANVLVNNNNYNFTDPLTENTTYYWRIVADYGCGMSNSNIFSFTTDGPTNIRESIQGNVFTVSPNPADGFVTLHFENPLAKDVNIELMPINGQRVKAFQMQ